LGVASTANTMRFDFSPLFDNRWKNW